MVATQPAGKDFGLHRVPYSSGIYMVFPSSVVQLAVKDH